MLSTAAKLMSVETDMLPPHSVNMVRSGGKVGGVGLILILSQLKLRPVVLIREKLHNNY